MPLPKCNMRGSYSAILYTFGPYHGDHDHQKIWEITRTAIPDHLDPRKFTCAFEESEDGYKHCHVAMGFRTPLKPNAGMIKVFKSLCTEEPDRKINCGTNYVPRGDKQAANCGGPYAVLRKYLTDPHKKKTTDDGAIEFVPQVKPRPSRPVGVDRKSREAQFYWDLEYTYLPNLALVKEGKKPGSGKKYHK